MNVQSLTNAEGSVYIYLLAELIIFLLSALCVRGITTVQDHSRNTVESPGRHMCSAEVTGGLLAAWQCVHHCEICLFERQVSKTG